ncbi:hypothetical protein [Bradyrhizobium sp. CCBAU 53380]|uniref:hypothetical protein n=1 Tax=Bradyrhizobium sp. CCBAU 53380 TaxID=1325117 RepID=UPI002303FDAC|nr:hypothetical protein [Bradyrhizobium sp. CCBAU 53380]
MAHTLRAADPRARFAGLEAPRNRRFPPSPALFVKILLPALAGSHQLPGIIATRTRR